MAGVSFGISNVVNDLFSGLMQMRSAGAIEQGMLQNLASPGQGGIQDDTSSTASTGSAAVSQTVNIDTQNFDYSAPRGTYLNIMA